MPCQRCNSQRVILVSAKCSDCCNCEIGEHESDGYVPQDVVFGAGGYGDYVSFKLCLDCGQMQGGFPQPTMALERGGEED
jgi:hypothetical protein